MDIGLYTGQFTPGYTVAVDVASIQLFGDSIAEYTRRIDTVSYTHLDVYKRQGNTHRTDEHTECRPGVRRNGGIYGGVLCPKRHGAAQCEPLSLIHI